MYHVWTDSQRTARAAHNNTTRAGRAAARSERGGRLAAAAAAGDDVAGRGGVVGGGAGGRRQGGERAVAHAAGAAGGATVPQARAQDRAHAAAELHRGVRQQNAARDQAEAAQVRAARNGPPHAPMYGTAVLWGMRRIRETSKEVHTRAYFLRPSCVETPGVCVVYPNRTTVRPSESALPNPTGTNFGVACSAFPPNFIHSVDSAHMMLTAIACNKAGLSFAGVHDSYWTHAG